MADQIWPNALSLRLRAAHCAPFDLILFAVFYFYYSLCTVLAADSRLPTRCWLGTDWAAAAAAAVGCPGNDAELNSK